MEIPIPELLTSAERELALRKSAYPGFIRRGTMRPDKAAYEIACAEGWVKLIQDKLGFIKIGEEMLRDWPRTPFPEERKEGSHESSPVNPGQTTPTVRPPDVVSNKVKHEKPKKENNTLQLL